MPNQSLVLRSFVGGEVSPDLGGRADLARYVSGAKLLQNFQVHRAGGISKRPGTKYVAAVKTAANQPKLLKFVFKGDDQSYVLEFGDQYVRFYWHRGQVQVSGVAAYNGATAYVPGDLVSNGGTNYYCKAATTGNAPPNATYWHPLSGTIFEVPTPYALADVDQLWGDQMTDTLTLTHPSYPVYELQRNGHTDWVLAAAAFAPTISAPTNVAGVAGVAGALTYRYKVTAAKKETFEESVGSTTEEVTCGPPTEDNPNTLTWDANADAQEYYVHLDPFGNGIFGFIGTATSNSFNDPGLLPDPTITPPILKEVFDATGKYPGKATHHQQRQCFAASTNARETVWCSRIAARRNFAISTPLQDDDAIEFVIAGKHLNPVAWLVSLKPGLVVLNDEGAHVAQGDESGVLRPTGINPRQESYVGAHPDVEPVVVGQTILYVDDSKMRLRHLTFSQEGGGFDGGDKTIVANHLFDGYTIVSCDYQRNPHSVVWAVRSDGVLLGFTYVPEQEVEAWHRHTTDGTIEQVITLPNPSGDDDVYLLVNRTIEGNTVRYIEVFGPRFVPDVTAIEDAFFVDCGLTYDGAPATTFTGLDHLDGERVAVLADGVVISDGRTGATSYTIVNGALSPALSAAASVVQIGLPMPYADLNTLELDVQGTSLRDTHKRVAAVTLLLRSSRQGVYLGPDADHLTLAREQPFETASTLKTGQSPTNITATWSEKGQVYLRHTDPLPFMVVGVIPSVEIGG
jgi:hypothetical protein